MSAADSGFILPYVVVKPTSGDLTGVEKGARVYQFNSRFNIAQPIYSEWYITKDSASPIYILPLGSKYIRTARAFTPSQFTSDFAIRNRN